MAEDELRRPDLLDGMHLDGNPVAVILHCDSQGRRVSRFRNRDADMLDGSTFGLGGAAYKGVAGIHDELIEEFVEARVEIHGAKYHLSLFGIPDPARLAVRISRADIGVWELEDMLAVRVLLIR